MEIIQGKHNLLKNMFINKLWLYPNSECILYYEKNYRHIAYIFENSTQKIKSFYIRKKIKSVFIYPNNLNKIINSTSIDEIDDIVSSSNSLIDNSTSIFSIINTFSVSNKIKELKEYKSLKIEIPLGSIIFGNDIHYDFDKKKFIRKFISEKKYLFIF